MKKATLLVFILSCILTLSLLSLQGNSQAKHFDKPTKCGYRANPLTVTQVTDLQAAYVNLISIHPDSVIQQIHLNKRELTCLSKGEVDIKLITAYYADIDRVRMIVELYDGKKYEYFDLDEFLSANKRLPPPTHTCPPPSNCGVPFDKKEH